MGRLLLLVLVFGGLWLIVRLMLRWQSNHIKKNSTEKIAQRVVQCAHCHTFVPSHEAIIALDGRAFCSPAHEKVFQQSSDSNSH